MFPIKYVAVNDITGFQIKTFRTLWGAKRWYLRPFTILGTKFSKEAIFISIYPVIGKA